MGSGAMAKELKEKLESCSADEVDCVVGDLCPETLDALAAALAKRQAAAKSREEEAFQRQVAAKLASVAKGSDSDHFFHGLTCALTATLQKQYATHVAEATSAIQRAHDESLEKERTAFRSDLLSLAERVAPKPGDVGATSETTTDADRVFLEAAQLQQQVSAVSAVSNPHLDGAEVPYTQATAQMLREVVSGARHLEEYGKQRLAALTCEFCPKGLTGKGYPVTVRPAVDTVQTVKQAIRAKYDCQSCIVKLCTTTDGMVEMKDSHLLMDYSLVDDITLIMVDSLVANPLVRLSFDDPENLGYEAISGSTGTFQNSEEVTAVNSGGKRGVNFDGRGCLLLPQAVQLGSEWTISVWTLAPIDVAARTYRDLIDSPNSQELIAVILARGRLGNYNSNSFVEGFNARELADGWHHIAVVGRNRRTSYYVDGLRIGSKRSQARGTIGVVGNSRGCREAWGVMSDFQMFAVAADENQIKGLYQSGAPGGSAPTPPGEPWQQAVDRQNLAEEDSSSYGSETSSDNSAIDF